MLQHVRSGQVDVTMELADAGMLSTISVLGQVRTERGGEKGRGGGGCWDTVEGFGRPGEGVLTDQCAISCCK